MIEGFDTYQESQMQLVVRMKKSDGLDRQIESMAHQTGVKQLEWGVKFEITLKVNSEASYFPHTPCLTTLSQA